MIEDSSKLIKGQQLRVDLGEVGDRLPQKLYEMLSKKPQGELVGYKMVDGNEFGLVLKFESGKTHWFFERELTEISEIK
tara:strand:+ start:346 stop:582 length:237 start_codon:yes stop_codon:yes gene_type:complete